MLVEVYCLAVAMHVSPCFIMFLNDEIR